MDKPGFIRYKKKDPTLKKVKKRLKNHNEFQSLLSDKDLRCQWIGVWIVEHHSVIHLVLLVI